MNEKNKIQIGKLEGCKLIEQRARLTYCYSYMSAALSIDNGKKALICFPNGSARPCEIFDSETSKPTFKTNVDHEAGKLGMYQGKPTAIGDKTALNTKVETLSASGWSFLADLQLSDGKLSCAVSFHILIGLPSGSLLLAGGELYCYVSFYDSKRTSHKAIWLLENDTWEKIGDLRHVYLRSITKMIYLIFIKPNYAGSAIMIKNSIFIVSYSSIERLDFEGNQLLNQEVFYDRGFSLFPVLLEAQADYCV